MNRIVTLAVIAAAILLKPAATQRYQFPSSCTCKYKGIPTECKKFSPSEYPSFEDMRFFDEDCLPTIPANHRVCYRMDISDCHDENNRGYYGCRLYLSGPRLGPRLKLKQLSVTRGNHSKVLIDSVNGTESNTVCFYNVSVSNDSSENCSLARLQHKVNHPESKYVDRDTQPDSDSSTDDSLTFTDCRSYVSVYYYSEQGHRHLYGTFCGKQLATLNQLLPATQLFLVSWTNNDVQNNRNSSFHLRAQCIE